MNRFDDYYAYNCGGYALGLPICIYGENGYSIDECTWGLLHEFNFIRLIDKNEQPQEYEYKVYYRVGNGHHFVKEDNGILTDKWEAKEPSPFHGWDNLENAPEVIFAVKRKHEQDHDHSVFINKIVPENFERTVKSEIIRFDSNKIFKFDRKEYKIEKEIKKDSGFFTIYDTKKDKIAEAIYIPKRDIFDNRENFIMEIEPGRKEEVISEEEKNFFKWRDLKNEIINGEKKDGFNKKEKIKEYNKEEII